jgi:hypothetical protein
MMFLRVPAKMFPSLLMTVAFMTLIDYVLLNVPVPGWIPVLLIALQALYLTMTYGFILMSSLIPAQHDASR